MYVFIFRKSRRKESPEDSLPTILSESEVPPPYSSSMLHKSSKGKKKSKKTHFYIDEEETDQLLNKPIEIVIDPPSDSASINNKDENTKV